MTKHTWQRIYAAGEQLNRYPYDFIVSAYFRHRPSRADGSPVRVLDLGCGAGNHTLFFAENGAEVVAVDFSSSALEVVKQRAEQQQLADRVHCERVDFEDFALEHDGFDVVIDRLSVSHVSGRHAARIYDCAWEAMRSGGILLSNLFSAEHGHKQYGRYDDEADIWCDFSGGIFEHLDTACFYDEAQVRRLLHRFELVSLVRETAEDLVDGDQKQIWKIIARKN